ncbi:acyl-CoA dehydrogenase family protein [Streptomyces sp. Marseille-Q5077]|uniref:acyl-CoA dehydrogenase family protein n=1 Tax=Streptomyces sp. Marseille-Q5077 TaxID=3418995 RepID=UPI003CFDAF4E
MTSSAPAVALSHDAFRQEVRRFFRGPEAQRTLAAVAGHRPDEEAARLDLYRLLGERGWLAPNWPVAYGGLGLGAPEAAVVTEEMTLAGVPDDVHVLSIDIVGMFLLKAGTEEQKSRYLPALARGEQTASVLFTEPEAGSDLSALRTRAERDGEGWRLYGTKVFNMKTQFADFSLCAARTTDGAVGMHGITLFLLPVRSPGVHIEPVPSIQNDRFNLVVIDGVRLTAADVVGTVDEGWWQLNELLQLERTGIDFHGKARRLLDLVIRRAAETGRLTDPAYALQLVELDAKLRAARSLAWEMVHNLAADRADPVTSAMSKWYASEQFRPILRAGMDLEGAGGVLSAWDGEAPAQGLLEANYRLGPAHRLASGTSEIMLYLIATNGLGLL